MQLSVSLKTNQTDRQAFQQQTTWVSRGGNLWLISDISKACFIDDLLKYSFHETVPRKSSVKVYKLHTTW